MRRIAIILARGGSKRILRKNIKDFVGKPIVAYSIEIALKSCLFDEVMVSTDDEEIAKIAKQYGAQVPFFRSDRNSDDYATTASVMHEVLHEYMQIGKKFDYICCIYPTAPFIQIKYLKEGYKKLIENNLYSVFPVVPFSFPIWRGLKRSNGKTSMLWPEYMAARSQDLESVYHDAGQWYWLKVSTLKDKMWTTNTDTIIIGQEEVQDIDTEEDWRIAELKYKILNA